MPGECLIESGLQLNSGVIKMSVMCPTIFVRYCSWYAMLLLATYQTIYTVYAILVYLMQLSDDVKRDGKTWNLATCKLNYLD